MSPKVEPSGWWWVYSWWTSWFFGAVLAVFMWTPWVIEWARGWSWGARLGLPLVWIALVVYPMASREWLRRRAAHQAEQQ